MKKLFYLLLLICLNSTLIGVTSSCRQASKYADDVWKAADDKIDDVYRSRKSGPKKPPRKKRCKECNGTGIIYDYWGAYECSRCDGEGTVYINY